MRFRFDERKSIQCRNNPRRGIGFEEAQELWGKSYYLDRRSEDPEQWRAIGWVGGSLFSMKKTSKSKAVPKAEQIAAMADKGRDISAHFTNTGRMMPAIRRVNVDFAENMLRELDALVREMNVSRQAVIKSFLRLGLDQHYLARKRRSSHVF